MPKTVIPHSIFKLGNDIFSIRHYLAFVKQANKNF